ncbi:uncharacterized protein LOC144677509 [Cetorhinus maximus]
MSLAANQDAVPLSEGALALQLSDDGLLPCFYGFTSRREVEELLKEKPLGSFLLRMSESQAGIVLSYSGTDRCRHFIIEQRPEHRYRILGEELLHDSIPELLDFHKKVPILPFVEYLTTACEKVPDKLYEDIDRIRRRRPGACEAGGGGPTAGVTPNVPEDGAGSTSLPGATAFDPKVTRDPHHWATEGAPKATLDDAAYQEVPDKLYEDIDRIRRRKPGACEVGGGGPTASVIPAGSTSLPGATAFDPKAAGDPYHWAAEAAAKATLDDAAYQEVPDKLYEDIDRIRRRKPGACEPGGGGPTAGVTPNAPEDGAGSTSLPGATAFDPKVTRDPHHWAAEGAPKATLDDAAYQEVPDKLYEDIDRIRRRRPGACEAGGGGPTAGVAPNAPEDGAGSTSLPGATAFDPKVTHDPQHWAAKVTLHEATYQEIPEARTSARDASRKSRSSCPAEEGVGPDQPSQEAPTYARVNKAKRHIYTEPGPRPSTALETTHTYADPRDGAEDERLTRACGRGLHHVYSELDLQQARRGNLYCPAPTKGAPATPDLPPRPPQPTAPPGWPSPLPLLLPLPPSPPPTYAQPARRSLGLPLPGAGGPARGGYEMDDPAYGPCPRPAPGRPEPAARPPPATRPGRAPPATEPHQAENLYERVPEEYLRPPPFAPSRSTPKRDL